jgi:phage recombination protein Bet
MAKELAVTYKTTEGRDITLTPDMVQKFIASGNAEISIQEYKFFTELCAARGLNPFLREAYLIKYSKDTPAQLIVGKDAIIKRAVTNPKFDGMQTGVIIESENGVITERTGLFYNAAKEKVIGGWARVFRKDWTHPIYVSVSVSEAATKTSKGGYNIMWATKTATMIEKVAKVRALREAFTDELSGMYDNTELSVDASLVPNDVIDLDDVFVQINETNETNQPDMPERAAFDVAEGEDETL